MNRKLIFFGHEALERDQIFFIIAMIINFWTNQVVHGE